MNSPLPLIAAANRALLYRPGYAALAIATIALAIAANATIFSLVKGVLLEPLPYGEARRLVTLDVRANTGFLISTSIPNYRDFRDRSRVFEAYAGESGWSTVMTGVGAPEVISARAVIGDFFGTLGIEPMLGRTITATEAPDRDGGELVVVLGHAFWSARFGADPGIVGRTVTLYDRPYTVVGVLPPGVGYPSPEVAAYYPMAVIPDLPWDDRDSGFGTRVVARLAPGVALETAREDLARVGRELRAELGPASETPEVVALDEHFLGDLRTPLYLLSGAVICLLLIAIANVGSLALVRGEERQRELAVRAALGASRTALVRLLVVESLVIALVGGATGAALAWSFSQALLPYLPAEIPAVVRAQLDVDAGVLGFAVTLAAFTGVAFGLLPAFRVADANLAGSFKSGSRAVTGGRGRLRDALVVTEIALALMLSVGAGLTLKSLDRLRNVDKGFDATNLLTAGVAASHQRLPTVESWVVYSEALREQAAALPGVESAALALLVPLADRSWERRVYPEGVPITDEAGDSMLYNIVSPEYFSTLGLTLLKGRLFTAADRTGTLPVTVIDETMAAKFWPGRDPIGQRIAFEADASGAFVYRTVVGVVKNLRHYTLAEPSRIQGYVPVAQSGRSVPVNLRVILKTAGDPALALAPFRDLVTRFDPEAPVTAVQTLADLMARATGHDRALATLLAAFAAGALSLAVLGIFGVMSYAVAQRTREIGIRMALGATRDRILGWVGGRAARLTLWGLVLGAAGAAAASRLLASVLFEVDPLDPAVFLMVGGMLVAAALAAAWLPARRAVKVDPAVVLAEEG